MVYYKYDKNLLVCKKMSQHLENCKYCDESVQKNIASFLTCHKCDSNIHINCLRRRAVPSGIVGDEFFTFTCAECSTNHNEIFIRPKLTCLQILVLVIYHLHYASPEFANKGFFHWKLHIESFIEKKWNSFFPKTFPKKSDWAGNALEMLAETNQFLMSGEQSNGLPGWWKLTHKEVSPAFTIRICNKRKLHFKNEDLQCARKFITKYGSNIEFEEVQLPDESEVKIELLEKEEEDRISIDNVDFNLVNNVDLSIVKQETDDTAEFETQIYEPTSEIWEEIESLIAIKIPKYLQRVLEITGFDSLQLLKIAPTSWIDDIENFIKTSDPNDFLHRNEKISDILGPIYKTVSHFRIPPGHKVLLNIIKRKLIMQNSPKNEIENFEVTHITQIEHYNFDDERNSLESINNTLKTWVNTNHYKIDHFEVNLTQTSSTILCPFAECRKTINIYKDTKRNRWVVSNFTTHYKNHLKTDANTTSLIANNDDVTDQPCCSKTLTLKRFIEEQQDSSQVMDANNKKHKTVEK